jgi:NAD(P)-dependent dehydrogenase (short-subunit alcohol dehydrogenase family)
MSESSTQELAGEIAIVTGGGRGIGRAIALAFAEAGAAVMVSSRSAEQIEETVSLIKAAGGRAVACPADVTDLAAVQHMLDVTAAELGPPTVLVNNAGGGVRGSGGKFENMDPTAIVKAIETDLLAAMLLTRLALPGMLERGHGRIINVASGAAMLAMPFVTPYTTAKTAIVRFSEALSLELLGRGVTVFPITPGNVITKLTKYLYPGRDQVAAEPPADTPWVYPAGHALADDGWFPPERVAALCLFLASGKADAVSGRFFSVHYDENDIVAQAELVQRDELYTLRIPTLQGVEPAIYYRDPAEVAKR